MRWKNTAYRRQDKGFTLVEVLVVVAIIALLIGVLVGVTGYLDTRKKTALAENTLVILRTAVAEYREETGHYPVDQWIDDDGDGQINSEVGSRLNGAVLADVSFPPAPDEMLYLQLNLLPQTRELIAKLPGQLIERPRSGAGVIIAGQESRYLQSIVDPWGNPLNYQRDQDNPDSVPPDISSDGPDGARNTGDDISG